MQIGLLRWLQTFYLPKYLVLFDAISSGVVLVRQATDARTDQTEFDFQHVEVRTFE